MSRCTLICIYSQELLKKKYITLEALISKTYGFQQLIFLWMLDQLLL